MLFSSVLFLVGFFPLFFGIYYLIPGLYRNIFLFLASLLFYGWYEPGFLLLILSEIGIGYFCGIGMQKFQKQRKWIFLAGLISILGFLVFFKYTNFILETVQTLFSVPLNLPGLVLPLGISFYTFQILSYLIDVYKKEIACQNSLIRFGMYVTMFPQLIAGPIVRYQQIEGSLQSHPAGWKQIENGLLRFVTGLAKKVLLANGLFAVFEGFRSVSDPSLLFSWTAVLANLLYIYFDFSGYSDMAIGMGAMLGFQFPENFQYPLWAENLTSFWRRWHMSLTTWFRDYVYIPLGGNRCSLPRNLFNLFVVWLLTGIWHGAGWTYVIWGIAFFILLAVEKYAPLPVWPWVQRVWMLFWVLILFLLFSEPDLKQFVIDLNSLFNLSLPLWNQESVYLLVNNAVLLAIAVIASSPYPRQGIRSLWNHVQNLQPFLFFGFTTALYVLCLATLISETFNPFLYFRF